MIDKWSSSNERNFKHKYLDAMEWMFPMGIY
jgi:hypothetical protein